MADVWYCFNKAMTGEWQLSVYHGQKPTPLPSEDKVSRSPLVKLEPKHFFPDGRVNLDVIIEENPSFANVRRAVKGKAGS